MLNAQVYYLDSTDRLTGTSSDFQVELPNFKGNMNVDSIVCTGAVIPKSWYLVNTSLNTFTLTENVTSYTVTIPIGNYSFPTLRSALQTALNDAGAYTYAVTANQRLGKYVLTVTGNGGVQPVITFPAYSYGQHPLARALGFDSTETFAGDVLTSSYVANLQLTNAVKIMTSFAEGGTLCDIFSASVDYANLRYDDQLGSIRAKPLERFTNVIDIQVVDYVTEQPLDLQGGEVLLTVVIFKKSTAIEQLRNIGSFFYNNRKLEMLEREVEALKSKTTG